MPRRPLVALFSGVLLAATLYAGARPVGPLPALGAILDPVHGAWGAAIHAELPSDATATIPGLGAGVEVRYDRRGVPHIFAESEEDAVRALGWVVARDRLFQLELQTRAASGRLSELVGAATLEADRETRRIGLPRAAAQRLAALPDTSVGRRMIEAYAQGVNAWIDELPVAQRPVEYRLLGAHPERWEPINSLLLFGRMGYTLSWSSDEWARLRVQGLVGREAAAALFPPHSPIQEPIQPNGAPMPRYDFAALPPPGEPDSSAASVAALLDPLRPDDAFEENRDRLFASNNWAVAPSRSASGHALLAGDPHLELTLPSIWYEVHVVVPGKLDVYGVTIPGAPGVIIGFNRDIAWTFTNTGADVLDFWREVVDDPVAPTRTRLDGGWRPVERRIERHLARDGRVLATDTLYFSHRGPLWRTGGEWHSMRWTVLEPSREVEAFAAVSSAKSAREFHDAIARDYFAPAQNMLVADRGGSISIRSTGHFPIRPRGDGLTVHEGTTSASDWSGYWPVERYPQSFDPAQGFLASANQEPIDPREAFAWLGGDAGFEPWRALQINRLLRADASVTVDEMRAWQTDPGSVRADLFAPAIVEAARRAAARPGAPERLASAVAHLAQWDRRYTRENTGAVLFEAAMRELALRTWDELRAGENGRPTAMPSAAVLLGLLRDSASAWWDDRATPATTEDRDAIVGAALAAAWDSVRGRWGAPEDGGWAWSKSGTARVWHLLRLPTFSALDLPIQGGRGTLNPSSGGGFGASWRMVVELGPELRAWATYPGGQSGNPVSTRFRDRLGMWQAGELDSLVVPRALAESERDAAARARLVPPSR